MTRRTSIDSASSLGDNRADFKGEKDVITVIESDSSIESDALERNPFLDPKVEEYYRDLYTSSRYESYSAFDPT
ncbi:hypothetical protein KGF57_000922, partial [Candida theae]